LWTANMLQAQADIIRAAQKLLIINDFGFGSSSYTFWEQFLCSR